MSKLYFVATNHEVYRQQEFEPGSIVIDPWRVVSDQPGVTVKRIGQNRPALISLLVPTRGRPQTFTRMISSAFDTAVYPDHIEVVAWLDHDDASPYPMPDRPLFYVVGERRLLSECWNRCAEEAHGEILMHCGDDVTFNTPGWDVRVRQEFDKLPDKIGLVFADDLSPNFPDLATHGFLHKRWVDTVGYFLPPLFSSDWNDVWISEVAKSVRRMRPMGDVIIEHHHYTFGKAERDQTHADREERGIQDDVVNLFKRTGNDRERDAAKLRTVMA